MVYARSQKEPATRDKLQGQERSTSFPCRPAVNLLGRDTCSWKCPRVRPPSVGRPAQVRCSVSTRVPDGRSLSQRARGCFDVTEEAVAVNPLELMWSSPG